MKIKSHISINTDISLLNSFMSYDPIVASAQLRTINNELQEIRKMQQQYIMDMSYLEHQIFTLKIENEHLKAENAQIMKSKNSRCSCIQLLNHDHLCPLNRLLID
jgi:hypothetical protein